MCVKGAWSPSATTALTSGGIALSGRIPYRNPLYTIVPLHYTSLMYDPKAPVSPFMWIVLSLLCLSILVFSVYHRMAQSQNSVITKPSKIEIQPSDPSEIRIRHWDGVYTVLRCKSGGGVVACRHDDLVLYQEVK